MSMTASSHLDRAQRRLAANGARHIGDLVAWNASSIDVERIKAREIFQTEGLGELIPDMEPATALSRAAAEVTRPAGILVRAFARPKGDTRLALGIYVMESRAGESGDTCACGARVRIEGDMPLALAPDGAVAIEAALAHAQAIATQAHHLITHCETKDISSAMVATAKKLSGVPLRDRGGFYLLPPATCGRWSRLKPQLEAIGVKPIRIEMHDAPDNVATAAAAAKGALEADIAELIADLERATTEGMRQHALTRRVEVCKELKAKAELYKGVLSGVAQKITNKLGDLERQFRLHLDRADDAVFTLPAND